MSPNLTPNEPQYSHHRYGYEQVVMDTINIIGLGENPWRLQENFTEIKDSEGFKIVELEHQNKGVLRRVFPSVKFYDDESIRDLSSMNQKMTLWYKMKCETDELWC